jgi:hypothetical protein
MRYSEPQNPDLYLNCFGNAEPRSVWFQYHHEYIRSAAILGVNVLKNLETN